MTGDWVDLLKQAGQERTTLPEPEAQKKPKKKRARRQLESSVEDYLEQRCNALGVFFIKNTGRNGIPDKLLIYDAIHWFVEVKRPGEKPNERQKAVARLLARHGAITLCVDSREEIDEMLDALVRHQDAPRSMVRTMLQKD